MKKYIRTEDGIYEATDWLEDGSCWCMNNGGEYFPKSEIKAEADTIEELCDEFVIVRNGEEPTILINYDNLTLLKARVVKDNQKVYGAIWTSKGLIYVAKMNDKGCLELL